MLFRSHVRVHAQRDSGRGMTEALRNGRNINAGSDELARLRAPQCMERDLAHADVAGELRA